MNLPNKENMADGSFNTSYLKIYLHLSIIITIQ